MLPYLAAHDELVSWLAAQQENPAISEVDERLRTLARCAAERGMTATHWIFVVDGLVAHVNRQHAGNILLASYVARGFDLSESWNKILASARTRRIPA